MTVSIRHGGPVQSLPADLICAECGGRTGDVTWEAAVSRDGFMVGMIGTGHCLACGRFCVGILSNNPRDRNELLEAMRQALADPSDVN